MRLVAAAGTHTEIPAIRCLIHARVLAFPKTLFEEEYTDSERRSEAVQFYALCMKRIDLFIDFI